MSKYTFITVLAISLAACLPDSGKAQTFTDVRANTYRYVGPDNGIVNSPEGVLRKSTVYTMYVPPLTNGSLRGTIVWIHNIPNGDSGKPRNPAWKALASEMRMALMEASGDRPVNWNWQHDHWTNYAASVTNAVAQLGIHSGHPELAQLGITLSGGSASANASVNMTANIPERIICTSVTLSGFGFGWWASAWDNTVRSTEPQYSVPMFITAGMGESERAISRVLRSYASGRAKDAPWTLAMHPTRGHRRIGENVLITFLRAFINLRMGPNYQPGQALNKIDITKQWLGNPKTYDVAAYADYTGDKHSAVWLPSQEAALAWKSFLSHR